MAPTLYYILGGPPSRTVLLLVRYLNLDVELRPVDMFGKREHLTPEFLEMNPSHSVPFLKDGEFILFESRAIAQYLVESQQPESQILGRFPKKRATINQFLQFDLGKLFPAVAGLYVSDKSLCCLIFFTNTNLKSILGSSFTKIHHCDHGRG